LTSRMFFSDTAADLAACVSRCGSYFPNDPPCSHKRIEPAGCMDDHRRLSVICRRQLRCAGVERLRNRNRGARSLTIPGSGQCNRLPELAPSFPVPPHAPWPDVESGPMSSSAILARVRGGCCSK
jgi:hypothetical protein